MSKQVRPETGPMQFGDDWRGVFLRGDNAGPLAMYLEHVLDDYEARIKASGEENADWVGLMYARQIVSTLSCSNQFVDTKVQMMKSFEECTNPNTAIAAIEAGIEDVKAGRTRRLDPSELEDDKNE